MQGLQANYGKEVKFLSAKGANIDYDAKLEEIYAAHGKKQIETTVQKKNC
jgi:beta-glucosidase